LSGSLLLGCVDSTLPAHFYLLNIRRGRHWHYLCIRFHRLTLDSTPT
jgi:hypothetical protein